jgi:hypothetical protein
MNTALDAFIKRALLIKDPLVLELGTLQSIPGRSTMHRDFVPHAYEFIGTDIQTGPDVDVVADIHRLSSVFAQESLDCVISCSTFEHLKYPHLAALEISKCLSIGGIVFVQTHHCFPLHAYPYDYFRFSREALEGCFSKSIGMQIIESCYEFPAEISSQQACGSDYLNACLFAQKICTTPRELVYEFDTIIDTEAK